MTRTRCCLLEQDPGKLDQVDVFGNTLLNSACAVGANTGMIVGLISAGCDVSMHNKRGIVPLFSLWLPHFRPVRGSTTPPDLDYYRRARHGFAELFAKYKLEPPGASGLNVCMCRDLTNLR